MIKCEGGGFQFVLICQMLVVIFFNNSLVFSGVLFVTLVDSTGLPILHNLAQNMYSKNNANCFKTFIYLFLFFYIYLFTI